jgi:predicted enzyme related to lactoylglutathione lyase
MLEGNQVVVLPDIRHSALPVRAVEGDREALRHENVAGMAGLRTVAVAVDARDPETLASFWSAALGTGIVGRWTDAHGTPYVRVALFGETVLLFQAVSAPTEGKNRMHLDLRATAGSDQRSECDRLVALGASVLDEAPDHPWIVLADPEGNEFCVLPAS